ncbi:MAG: radical SAM protein [Planctomycetota bacterium]
MAIVTPAPPAAGPLEGAPSAGLSPRRTTLMLKPVGAMCNLRCAYCYYLPVAEGYDAPAQRMGNDTLESILAGYLPGAPDEVTISWQGGEPTLAGLGFYERMIDLVERHRRPTQRVNHAFQTNGTRLDDRWAAFFAEHRFLIGVSLDGLTADHDHYRTDTQGRPTADRVLAGIDTLRRHRVEHNVLVVLNDRNVRKPREVWARLMNLGIDWVQFIPAVEWVRPHDAASIDDPEAWRLADFSPTGQAYGRFLVDVFDRWFADHRTKVSVRLFDAILSAMVHGRATECTFAESCAGQVTLEHDGSVYACDHFVEPAWRLGKVGDDGVAVTLAGRSLELDTSDPEPLDDRWMRRLDADRFHRFGDRKGELADACRRCEYLRLCHGGCPKHRPARDEIIAPSALCDGYRAFFDHAVPRLEWLAGYLRRGVAPPPKAPRELDPAAQRRARSQAARFRPRRKRR